MIERHVEIVTEDGAMQTFVCHPERGVHPVILLYMDAYGVREELRDMARRLGTCGYYVMLPNLYHRLGVFELGPIPEPDDQRRINKLLGCVQSLDVPQVMRDTCALFGAADSDPAADASRAAALGYCVSGRFAVAAAVRFPDRVRCAASIHGTSLVSDDPESPHRSAGKSRGEIYFACAEIDHWMPLEVVETLKVALTQDRVNAEIEIYAGVEHGFAFKSRHAYNRVADDRHWERFLALCRRNLG